MPDLKLLPISFADNDQLAALMREEELAWMDELGWDYSPVRQILTSFVKQKLLPGYVASDGHRTIGYTYFLTHQAKGIIGTVYASRPDCTQETADKIMALAIEYLKGSDNIRRIEAQIIPFHDLNLSAGFTRHGFQYYPRYYLELDLNSYTAGRSRPPEERIVPWNSALIPEAAEVTLQSYRDQTDAAICQDYCSLTGSSSYLHSLIENPGCGMFLHDASWMALNARGLPCGFIIGSRISASSAMIPQIAIAPAYQGRGLGNALMDRALSAFKRVGFQRVTLTVTKKNRRAFEWYQRLGFKIRKEFGAFVWDRTG